MGLVICRVVESREKARERISSVPLLKTAHPVWTLDYAPERNNSPMSPLSDGDHPNNTKKGHAKSVTTAGQSLAEKTKSFSCTIETNYSKWDLLNGMVLWLQELWDIFRTLISLMCPLQCPTVYSTSPESVFFYLTVMSIPQKEVRLIVLMCIFSILQIVKVLADNIFIK